MRNRTPTQYCYSCVELFDKDHSIFARTLSSTYTVHSEFHYGSLVKFSSDN